MFGLSTIQTAGAAFLLLSLTVGGAYVKGRSDGDAIGRVKTLQAINNQLNERGETDAEVRDLDVAGLCADLGGSVPECEEYR